MRVLITGVTGMDGWHLAELLRDQGHTVVAMIHGQREREVPTGVLSVQADLMDQSSLVNVLRDVQPHTIYNLGAITSIGLSWKQPDLMANVTGLGILRLLEAIRLVNKNIRLVQASTADQFGHNDGTPLDETATFAPRTPYGVAKQFAHDMCLSYREAYNMHVSTLILFNHSSERHGREFIVRKVTSNIARIKREVDTLQHVRPLQLGPINAVRDWGYAPDYVRAYPLAAARDVPDDYVIATGVGHTVRELVWSAFACVGLKWEDHTTYDHDIGRPADVAMRIGNADKAKRLLGWYPRTDFETMLCKILENE